MVFSHTIAICICKFLQITELDIFWKQFIMIIIKAGVIYATKFHDIEVQLTWLAHICASYVGKSYLLITQAFDLAKKETHRRQASHFLFSKCKDQHEQ